ncbi:ABC transporter ATP-binding protein [Halobacteriales archaeon SW_10_66_29]|nr:MAG: ABC transporter ATP-binding protein [Halobacteriales archaeon SW_10_66_29]
MAEVRLDGITRTFGDEAAVDDVDLTVRDGEILGVVGPSGCGKTTTLRTIAGFETPDAGRVLFDGEDVTHVPPERRNVGLVFQSYALFDNMSVAANVAFGLKMQGVGRTERRERAEELLELLDIAELADRSPTTLSGGQQQRVGLARALAVEPDILLLDEPMTGLDANLKERLRTELGSLLEELGVTALYVTHDQQEAMVMCDRIAVLNDGTVEQVGDPAALYERPANQFVADFVGTSNVLPATVAGGTLDLGFTAGPCSLPDTGDGKAIVRPDDFVVGGDDVEGVVRDRFYLGGEVRARVELPDGQLVTVALDGRDRAVGDAVALGLDTDALHVVDAATGAGAGGADSPETTPGSAVQ